MTQPTASEIPKCPTCKRRPSERTVSGCINGGGCGIYDDRCADPIHDEADRRAARAEGGAPATTIEVRPNANGTPDEVVLYVDGRCVAHLEQMSHDHWWLGFYPSGGATHVNFSTKRGAHIDCLVEEERPPRTAPAAGAPAAESDELLAEAAEMVERLASWLNPSAPICVEARALLSRLRARGATTP